MTHPAVFPLATGVALISAILAFLGARAYARVRDERLLLVTSAFFVFFVKNALVAYDMKTGTIGHGDMEFISTLMDLIVVVLIVAPFLRK